MARIVGAISASGEPELANYPERVCTAGVDLLGMCGAGLNLITTKTQMGAVWASDKHALTVEDLQFTLGEGPACDAFNMGAPALEPFLADATGRWPFFRPKALDFGVRAVFSFPLQTGVIRLGALDLFRAKQGFLSLDELADALVLADVATHDIIDIQTEGALHWPLSDDLGHRAKVHQATGMVSAQMDSDMAAALARIRAYAFANEMSIFDVADRVISRQLRLTGQP